MYCLAGKRILVVEDEPLVADDIACELGDAGAIVAGPFATCPEALHALAHDQIDAAILDIRLGEATAYSLAERLSERHVPFLFHTGYGRDAVRTDFARVVHIEKPSPKGALMTAVQQLLQ